jgi:stage II sporulation protein AA (anti-sigma F factor antagonist)
MSDIDDVRPRRHPAADGHGELGLTVEFEERDGVTVVTAHGVIDFWNVGPLQERLHHALQDGLARLVLDLGDVSFLDSTGLGLLLSTHDRTAEAGGWLRLAHVQPLVSRVLQTTNLDSRLHIYATTEAATGRA